MELMDAYVDGELDAAGTREVEWHVGECARCARALAGRRALVGAVREHALRYRAPEDLRQAVSGVRRISNPWQWASMALAACLAVAIGGWIWTAAPGSRHGGGGESALTMLIVDDHLRSLQGLEGGGAAVAAGGGELGRLVEVVSSDRHTVKPWFAGRLNFAPVVKDLKDAGFPLVGARMDVVNGREVAALVYRRDKHVINLFTWPAGPGEEDAAVHAEKGSNGYHIVRWVAGGMEYWAVSDVEMGELEAFGREFMRDE